MKHGYCIASLDLRHAYYSVSIKPEFRKSLKFKWKGQLYAYTCFANGLCNCPRYLTKLLKPVYAHLRSQGFLSASVIDDLFERSDLEGCQEHVERSVELFQNTGFHSKPEKSVLVSCKKTEMLGVLTELRRRDCHPL